ncbi:MAG: hypothetical protein ABSB42_03490 [Tepidisphaeraceae bacterium]
MTFLVAILTYTEQIWIAAGRTDGEAMKTIELHAPAVSPYVSPKELQERWRCSRSSVDRIVRRAGLTRLCLGEGRNGIVRYNRKEVEEFEIKRQA